MIPLNSMNLRFIIVNTSLVPFKDNAHHVCRLLPMKIPPFPSAAFYLPTQVPMLLIRLALNTAFLDCNCSRDATGRQRDDVHSFLQTPRHCLPLSRMPGAGHTRCGGLAKQRRGKTPGSCAPLTSLRLQVCAHKAFSSKIIKVKY